MFGPSSSGKGNSRNQLALYILKGAGNTAIAGSVNCRFFYGMFLSVSLESQRGDATERKSFPSPL